MTLEERLRSKIIGYSMKEKPKGQILNNAFQHLAFLMNKRIRVNNPSMKDSILIGAYIMLGFIEGLLL